MERQKKNESGITLVALVVSIIVMLVLAGVSLNATIGENGIVTKAQEATLKQRIAEELENLNLELAKLNIDTISTDETMAIQDIANYLVGKGTIDSFVATSAGQIAAGIDTSTGNKYFFGTKGDNTYRITRGTDGLLSAELVEYSSGGDITGGYALVTSENFNNSSDVPENEKGKFSITSNAEVVFMDPISGELSINVEENVTATIGIYANITLTNKNLTRAAINLNKGSVLNIYIDENCTLTVNSGYGVVAAPATGNGFNTTDGIPGGSGAYAGIRVPWIDSNGDNERDSGEYATLNLHGSGTVIAYGGDASDGGDGGHNNLDWGGAGGGGAGAGIGGNGGNGGSTINFFNGNSGDHGENAGAINIFDSIIVKAFGGAGGTGGAVTEGGSVQSGGGGSGFPAAGIGGGGAGGTSGNTFSPGGGFGCGNGEYTFNIGGKNGCTVDTQQSIQMTMAGSYYESFASFDFTTYKNYENYSASTLEFIELNKTLWDYVRHRPYSEYVRGKSGGIGGGATECARNDTGDYFYIPDSAQAGKGGVIKYSSTARIYAYNGSYITTKDSADMTESERISSQALIYAQVGFNVKSIRETVTVKKVVARTAEDLITEWNTNFNNETYRNISYTPFTTYKAFSNGSGYGLGIGSGAGGYQEIDGNGSFDEL